MQSYEWYNDLLKTATLGEQVEVLKSTKNWWALYVFLETLTKSVNGIRMGSFPTGQKVFQNTITISQLTSSPIYLHPNAGLSIADWLLWSEARTFPSRVLEIKQASTSSEDFHSQFSSLFLIFKIPLQSMYFPPSLPLSLFISLCSFIHSFSHQFTLSALFLPFSSSIFLSFMSPILSHRFSIQHQPP